MAEETVETEARWDALTAMSEEECIARLDPICEAIKAATAPEHRLTGIRALPNRLLALAVLDLYETWNREVINRP